jgi:hypothetical protein
MKQKKERFFLLLMMYCNGSIDGKGGATAPVATITLAITVLHDYLLFVVALPFWLGPFLPYPHCPTLLGNAAASAAKKNRNARRERTHPRNETDGVPRPL